MNPRLFCRENSYHKTLLLTYSFDPVFFEQVVLADLWVGRSSDIVAIGDRDQVETSIAAATGRLSHLGRNYVLACSNHQGAFHPKVIIRVGPKDGIVMIGSGNVTSSGWGGNQELGAAWAVGPEHSDKGGWLHPFLDDVISWCDGDLEKDAIRRLKDVPWLSLTPFESELPSPILHSHQQQTLAMQLANRWAGRQFDEVKILTGSTDETGAFLRWAHDTFGIQRAIIALTPSMASFVPEKLNDLPLELKFIEAPKDRPLHAKFYWFQGPSGNAAVMGSANCSAAAWLLAPNRNGNVETILIYDASEPADFDESLVLFNGDHKSATELLKPRNAENPSSEPAPPFVLKSLRWSNAEHSLEVTLCPDPSPDAIIELLIHGELVKLVSVSLAPNLFRCKLSQGIGKGTVFASARIYNNGQIWTTAPHWIDDLATLEHASQSARLLIPFEGFSGSVTSNQQRAMLDDLKEVARTLFHEMASFRDPSFNKKHKDKAQEDDKPKAVNPQDLVLHIEDRIDSFGYLGSGHSETLSINGILRLLFDAEIGHNPSRIAEDDEGIDEGQIPQEPSKSLPQSQPEPNQIEERFRARLDQQITEFLVNFSSSEFAVNCTATQMVQAVSFPLAVALRGRMHGWVSDEQAEKWSLEIFSILFRRTTRGGLINEVESRYEENDNLDTYNEVVGDGCLWIVLVATLGSVEWHDVGGDIEKAVALREVFNAKQLLASAKESRVSGLLSSVRLDEARKFVCVVAPRVSNLLDQIEAILHTHWKEEMLEQTSRHIKHSLGDFMWRENSGWAVCLNDADTRYAQKVKVRLRGHEKEIANGYYVNVTEMLNKSSELNELIAKLKTEVRFIC